MDNRGPTHAAQTTHAAEAAQTAQSAQAATEQLTGLPPTSLRPLGGTVWEAHLPDGTQAVVKRHDTPNAALAEATSLTWLATAEAAPPLPRLRHHAGPWLVMDRIEPGHPTPTAAEEFGRRLAALHASGAPAFGAPPPGGPTDASIGLAPMRNTPSGNHNWAEWFTEHRIAPYTKLALDAGTLTPAEARTIEDVRVQAPDEPPARLHGDLWSGNVHWAADGRAWLIDPAAHGGHRETDLAMLALFGCPHLDRVLAAYHEAAPLADGWRDRLPLHQLFPLLVHAVLFGRGYAQQALSAARSLPS